MQAPFVLFRPFFMMTPDKSTTIIENTIPDLLDALGCGLSREDLRDEARRRLSQVKARAGEKGQYHCLKKGISHMFSPGLYYGVAGIGYEMLRAAAPEMVQSVFV